jgi:hypothetical protein
MILFWPWAIMGSDHILIAAKSFSHFAFNMDTLVNGKFVSIGEISRTYLFQYLSIRLPETFLIGIACIFLWVIIRLKRVKLANHLPALSVAIAVLFPLAFVLYDRPALYNGVRHFTFIIPPLAVVAGIGLSQAWDTLNQYKKTQIVLGILVASLTINTLTTLYKLRPYEYIYYNHFAGSNFKEAEHKWESDYWSSSLIETTQMLEDYLDKEDAQTLTKDRKEHYLVAVCAEAFQGDAYFDERLSVTEDWVVADFFISGTNMNCDKVLQGKMVGTVERLGATIAVVKDRRQLVGEDRRPRAAPRN